MNEIQNFEQLGREFEAMETRARMKEIETYKKRIALIEDEEGYEEEVTTLYAWIADLERDT